MSIANAEPGNLGEGVRVASLPGALFVTLLVLLSIFMPWRAGDSTDVSWLIVICEKLLDGQKLYVDIMETNPPFSVALYLGPVWLSRKLGVSAELMVQCFVYFLFFIALALSAAVIERGRLFRDLPTRWVYPMLTVLLLLAPGGNFGQREHLGMILFMPMLFLMMWRAETDRRVPAGLAAVVGVAASVLLLVKPHWALGIALPYLIICWRRRSLLACVTVENIVIGAICAAYLASTVIWFPEFFDTLLPALMRYYVSMRANWNLLVAIPAFALFLAFIALQMRKSAWRIDVLIAVASATGFFISMVYLGKYWGNHQYPFKIAMLTGMLLAVGSRWQRVGHVAKEEAANIRFHAGAALAIVAAVAMSHQFYINPEKRLVDSIKSRYDAPSIVQISSDLVVGYPLTRMVNGRWLSAYAQDWLGAHALWGLMQGWYQGDDERRARQDLEEYTNYVNGLIRDGKPDIILFDRMDKPGWTLFEREPPIWVVWMRANPEFQKLLDDYEEIAKGGHIEVYARRTVASTVSSAASPVSLSD